MDSAKKRILTRLRKKKSVAKKVKGNPERLRVSVFRSSRHIYVQAIDDLKQETLYSLSTLAEEVKKQHKGSSGSCDAAKLVGSVLGKKMIDGGVEKIVFDRNGFLYHGRVKSLAEGMREAGLKF